MRLAGTASPLRRKGRPRRQAGTAFWSAPQASALVCPAGVEPAISGAQTRRGGQSPLQAGVKNGPKSSRLVEPRPGVGHSDVGVTEALRGLRDRVGAGVPGELLRPRPGVGHGDENVTRLPQPFRSVLFDHRHAQHKHPMGTVAADAGFAGVGHTRRNRNVLTDRSHHGSAKPSRTSIGYSDGRDRTCASRLTVACLTARLHRNERRKERESNPQGRSRPVFETGYRTRWQSFQQVTPAGLEPARPRLRVGRSTELSYGARMWSAGLEPATPRVSGGRSTCFELRPRGMGEAGVEPAVSCL
jgi:hypothetical protein